MADWADEKAEQLLQWHDACEDSWYSCPQSMDGCADDSAGEECRCGLNERRAATAAALREAREPLEKEIAALRKQLADARKEASFVAFYEGRLEEERANAEQAYEHGREQGAREERERQLASDSAVNNWNVLKIMSARNMDIGLAPLSNVEGVTYNQKRGGSLVRIGYPGNILGKIARGGYLGGLILADVEQYAQVRRELEIAARGPMSQGGGE